MTTPSACTLLSPIPLLLTIILFFSPSICIVAHSKPSNTPPLSFQHVLDFHTLNSDSPRHNSNLLILGFLTPWNPQGKSVALSQASRNRLNIAVPVTWQMQPSGLTGGHDFSDLYYEQLSQSGARIYPRILFEGWNLPDFHTLSDEVEQRVEQIVHLCKGKGFEGVVVEIWQPLLAAGAFQGEDKKIYLEMVRQIGEAIRKKDIRAVLVLPPYEGDGQGTVAADLEQLSVGYNLFVTMTYDFSTPGGQAGPMAPVEWVEQVAKYLAQNCRFGEKLLIGLNFYGLDYEQEGEGRNIVGNEYVELLEKYQPDIMWLEEIGEHAFGYTSEGKQHVVFYPTTTSIAKRVHIVKSTGAGGVAIWEVGQGLNYFFDEF